MNTQNWNAFSYLVAGKNNYFCNSIWNIHLYLHMGMELYFFSQKTDHIFVRFILIHYWHECSTSFI